MINENLFETMERILILDLDRGMRLTRELTDVETVSKEGREIINSISLMTIASELKGIKRLLSQREQRETERDRSTHK
jgi:hypothetical protein